MRVWQIVGRVDELPKAGDWKEYRIFDQSFVIVRGKDDGSGFRQRLSTPRQSAVHRRYRKCQAWISLSVPSLVL